MWLTRGCIQNMRSKLIFDLLECVLDSISGSAGGTGSRLGGAASVAQGRCGPGGICTGQTRVDRLGEGGLLADDELGDQRADDRVVRGSSIACRRGVTPCGRSNCGILIGCRVRCRCRIPSSCRGVISSSFSGGFGIIAGCLVQVLVPIMKNSVSYVFWVFGNVH